MIDLFSIYENPTDFPGRFVVRRWIAKGRRLFVEARPTAVTDTLDAARAAVPPGRVLCPRDANEQAVALVETWL